MNILIVASKFPPEYSGPGVRIPRLYDAIKEELGVENIYVFCNGIEQTKNENYSYNGHEVRRRTAPYKFLGFLPARLKNFLAYLYENIQGCLNLRYYDQKNIDMVHIVGHSGGTAAALAWANKRKIPTVMELVTALAQPCQRFMGFFQSSPPKSSVIVTFRSDTEEKCHKAGFTHQVWKRPNPVNENRYHPVSKSQKNTLRKSHTPFSADDIVICTVAKLMPQKNQAFLIEVMKLLPPSFKLIIAGPKVTSGPLLERDQTYLKDLYQKVADYSLTKRIHIIPDYVDSAKFMKLSDIYTLPAYNEGFATPMIEAVACGLPVIANNGEYSFREWVTQGQNGFLCPLEPKDWAEAVIKASRFSEEQKKEQSDAIIQLAGQKNIYKTYIDLIKNLVSSTKA